jgi:hypothetical protein
MAEAETALQMTARHVAEQDVRVSEQEQLIARLRREGHPTDQAEGMLVEMCNLLECAPGRMGGATANGVRMRPRSCLPSRYAGARRVRRPAPRARATAR